MPLLRVKVINILGLLKSKLLKTPPSSCLEIRACILSAEFAGLDQRLI
jgi:hypothetical protein